MDKDPEAAEAATSQHVAQAWHVVSAHRVATVIEKNRDLHAHMKGKWMQGPTADCQSWLWEWWV